MCRVLSSGRQHSCGLNMHGVRTVCDERHSSMGRLSLSQALSVMLSAEVHGGCKNPRW